MLPASSTAQGKTLSYLTYSSVERNHALKLCGWEFVNDSNLEAFVKRYIQLHVHVYTCNCNDNYDAVAKVAVLMIKQVIV